MKVVLALIILLGLGYFFYPKSEDVKTLPQVRKQAKLVKGICLTKKEEGIKNPLFFKIEGIDAPSNHYEVKLYMPKSSAGLTKYETRDIKLSYESVESLTQVTECP